MLGPVARVLGALLAALCLIAGGLSLSARYAPELRAGELGRALVARGASGLATAAGRPIGTADVERALAGPVPSAALPSAGILLLLLSLRRLRKVPREGVPGLNRATRRRTEKRADALVKQGNRTAAAELLVEAGLLDQAADLFIEADQLVRAAEIRHDQNRFLEAAELNSRAGRHDAAASIYALQERPLEAAECYLKARRPSVAAEMFERAGEHARAAECYERSGFHRHAARAWTRCRRWGAAARALDRAIREEGTGRTGAASDSERRKLVLQAARLYEQAGQMDEAASILERGECFAAAAEVALRQERYARSADLFLRARDPVRAAEALRAFGEDRAAARILGEHHRDRGQAEEAARCFEEAGEPGEAGDLYRKLERFPQAAACYERQGDLPAAGEMYALAGDFHGAGRAFEAARHYARAAECYVQAGDPAREAELLEQGEQWLRAGEAYRALERDDAAIRVLQRIEPGGPDFVPASAALGVIFREKGMFSLSVKKLRQAIGDAELERANLEAHYALATVQEMNGDLREALDLYERILAFDYHYADVERRVSDVKARLEDATPLPGMTGGLPSSSGVARYEILEELGRGGMGIVYRARDTVLDRIVAYKTMPERLKENDQALRNFLREAKSAARLNHPNIVTVYDAGEQEGCFYIAMEYVDGTTLKEILRRRGRISAGGVLHVLTQMCEALAYAHEQNVVHRDVKTANTMWTRDKKAKIMDFGLAKVMEEVRNSTTLVSGTPYYMSPEQTLGRNVDHRTDIYSLGVTIFELATGRLPFQEGNVPYHHVHTPAPDPVELNPKLPPELAGIISRCLAKDPGGRYSSAREILAEARSYRLRSRSAHPVRGGGP